MKRITTAFSFAFFLIFGVFAYPQEASDNNKPQQQEEQKPEAKPEQAKPPKQEEPKPSKSEKPTQEQPPKPEGAKPAHEQHDQNAAQARQGRAAGKGGHIPDAKFRASFGRQHTFVISRPVIVAIHGPRIGPTPTVAISNISMGSTSYSMCSIPACASRFL